MGDGALVVIKDSGDTVFGVWLGEGLRMSKGSYYGSGESYVKFDFFFLGWITDCSFLIVFCGGPITDNWTCSNGQGKTIMWRYVKPILFHLVEGMYSNRYW
jgi:hypothetical protein